MLVTRHTSKERLEPSEGALASSLGISKLPKGSDLMWANKILFVSVDPTHNTGCFITDGATKQSVQLHTVAKG